MKQGLLARGCNDVPLVNRRLGRISGQGEVVLRLCLLVYLDLHLLAIARLDFCLQDLFPVFWLLSLTPGCDDLTEGVTSKDALLKNAAGSLLRTFSIGLFCKYSGHDC